MRYSWYFVRFKKKSSALPMKLAASNIEHQRYQSTQRIILYVHRKLTAVWIHYYQLERQLLNLLHTLYRQRVERRYMIQYIFVNFALLNLNTIGISVDIKFNFRLCKWVSWWCHRLTISHVFCIYKIFNTFIFFCSNKYIKAYPHIKILQSKHYSAFIQSGYKASFTFS